MDLIRSVGPDELRGDIEQQRLDQRFTGDLGGDLRLFHGAEEAFLSFGAGTIGKAFVS
jgi:hypothetical protein